MITGCQFLLPPFYHLSSIKGAQLGSQVALLPWGGTDPRKVRAGLDRAGKLNIVACQRGGVSNEPPLLQAAMRHGPGTI